MSAIDRAEVDLTVRALSNLMSWHLGSLSLEDVSDDGTVTVRFGGSCTACPLRPVTMAATIRKALLPIEGVRKVEAVGVQVSEYTERVLGQL